MLDVWGTGSKVRADLNRCYLAPQLRLSAVPLSQLSSAFSYRMRDVHPPLISKEEWREAKNRISMPDREAVILEEITGEGILSSLHPILFKEDIDV